MVFNHCPMMQIGSNTILAIRFKVGRRIILFHISLMRLRALLEYGIAVLLVYSSIGATCS